MEAMDCCRAAQTVNSAQRAACPKGWASCARLNLIDPMNPFSKMAAPRPAQAGAGLVQAAGKDRTRVGET